MSRETPHLTAAIRLGERSTRRKALGEIARRSGLVSIGVLAPARSAHAGPSADCKFHCKKKDRRKARRRCYDRCNNAAARCGADAGCVAEQVCGDARCMMICTSDSDCQPGSH